MISPESIPELTTAFLDSSGPVLAVGARTKPALSAKPGATLISTCRLTGILEYEPTEYTFTALPGTPISEIQTALKVHGQYLPFDPVLASAGSTLGGAIAASANGAGRIRFGGVRDFLVGIQFLDGLGRLIRGGGKVVKNAAGFDFPKLFTGSMGRLGVLTEVTFKVFPEPPARLTLEADCSSLSDAIDRLNFVLGKSWEIEAAEILPPGKLLLRIAGQPGALAPRMDFIASAIQREHRLLDEAASEAAWSDLANFTWVPPVSSLIKIPLTSLRISALDAKLGETKRVYSQGGNVAWVAWDGDLQPLHQLLLGLGLTGVPWRGGQHLLGVGNSASMETMVKTALDPNQRFAAFPTPFSKDFRL